MESCAPSGGRPGARTVPSPAGRSPQGPPPAGGGGPPGGGGAPAGVDPPAGGGDGRAAAALGAGVPAGVEVPGGGVDGGHVDGAHAVDVVEVPAEEQFGAVAGEGDGLHPVVGV